MAPLGEFATDTSLQGAGCHDRRNRDCDVTDDSRFLINVTNPAALNPVATPISVDINWTATLS
jgi:hypothetical protein